MRPAKYDPRRGRHKKRASRETRVWENELLELPPVAVASHRPRRHRPPAPPKRGSIVAALRPEAIAALEQLRAELVADLRA